MDLLLDRFQHVLRHFEAPGRDQALEILQFPQRGLLVSRHLCNQQLAGSATSFKTHEEHFDYAVSLMNGGQFDQARTHIEKILKTNPKADFAYYGMAVVDCLTGQVESSLKNLGESIRLNPQNRFQARNDSDFQNMADDPRFTELLYPEPTDLPSSTSDQRKR